MGRHSNTRNKRGQKRVAAAAKPPKPAKPMGECHFERLPTEVMSLVLGFVPATNLKSVLRVCRSWHSVIQSDQSLWQRWSVRELPAVLMPQTEEQRTTTQWRAHFRRCMEKHKVLLFNLEFQPEEVEVSGRHTLEDLLHQICDRHPRLRKERTVDFRLYLRRDDGEWELLKPGIPLCQHGLCRSGQRISFSRMSEDVDFHNLERHSIEELRDVYYNWGTPDPSWTKAQLVSYLSKGKLSQFESAYADIDF